MSSLQRQVHRAAITRSRRRAYRLMLPGAMFGIAPNILLKPAWRLPMNTSPNTANPEPAVEKAAVRYLEELETAIKQCSGVIPEDALEDTREFLHESLVKMVIPPDCRSQDERETWLWETAIRQLGTPGEIADAYAAHATPMPELPGYAPGWRICCTRCGRSAPAAKAGMIRIGAVSYHKYVVGYCRGCGGFRWLRVIQDLQKPILTRLLGDRLTAAELRLRMHHPWRVALGIPIAALTLATVLLYFLMR